jgi:HAD superfamily phosphoserine phosphatase-like hydrolase
VIYVCDFDGTVTTRDLGAALLARYGRASWHLWDTLATRGILPLQLAQTLQWRGVQAPLSTLRAEALRVAQLRPGLQEFLGRAHEHSRWVIIVSSGFTFYIDAVLGRLARHVAGIIANQLVPTKNGYQITWAPSRYACKNHRSCKAAVVSRLSGPAVLIGDGLSDTCGLDTTATV